ncbi:MAG: tetratricopeptide repeat protein, partial [Deltaproteobacteria bacterium]|nr:tetratricopeptide repeat protein [Deltaproteobacteria bacterium]
MKKFCPNCDKLVDVAGESDSRCPSCMQGLAAPPSEQAAGGSRKWLMIGVGVAVVAGVATGVCHFKPEAGKLAGDPVAQAGQPQDLAAKVRAAGLPIERAALPGQADAAMQAFAKAATSTADLASKIKALRGPGKLQPLRYEVRRQGQAMDTPALYAAVQAGTALPVHPIEAAFLARALLQARGETTEFVTESAGVLTPLTLTRYRLGVRLKDGTVVEPLGDAAMTKAQVVPEAQAVALWLVVRANAERARSGFKQAAEDLLAAEALVPGLPAIQFARGVGQLDQRMEEQGVASCEAALQKAPDPLAKLFMAQVAQSQQQPVKALQRCEEALQIAPGLPEALTAKAMLQLARVPTLPADQKDKALAEVGSLLDQALKADPPPPGARAAKGQWLLAKHEDQQAEMLLGQAVREHKDLEAGMLLAQVLQGQRKHEEAAKLFDTLAPPYEDERAVLAWTGALMAAKQVDKALEIAEKAFAALPDSHNIALLRADLLRQNGRVPEAIAALEPLKNAPDGDRMALLQAQLYLQNRQPNMALPIIEAVRKKAPTDRDAAMLHVVTLAMTGSSERADQEAQKAVADKLLKPLEVVEVWLQAGDLPRAQKILESEV